MRFRSLTALISPGLQVALGMFGLVIVVGTAGYMVLADLSFVDALYQCVTTLSTVGFRELAPFDTTTKLFTVALILVGRGHRALHTYARHGTGPGGRPPLTLSRPEGKNANQ